MIRKILCSPANCINNDSQWSSNGGETGSIFVGWGTLSLINAGLAQAKGRSGFLWWLLSLLPGPIATFLMVVFPPIPEV